MSGADERYRVVIEVSGVDLGVVLEGLSGPSVQLVSVSSAADAAVSVAGAAHKLTARAATLRAPRYANGVRNKGIRGTELLLELLAEGPMTGDQLCKRFVERGFAAKTASAALSQMRAAGNIAYVSGSNKWGLTSASNNNPSKGA